MWNEKKFFQDFVEESEKIKPDDEFVQQLKRMTNEYELNKSQKRKKQIYFVKYAAIAVSFLLCIIVGSVAWSIYRDIPSDKHSETDNYTMDIHAGNNNSEIQSGVIGKENDLERVISLVGDNNVIVEDENGEEISEGKRGHLLKMLNKAKLSTGTIDLEAAYTSYYCMGKEKIEIKIYNSEYIVIGNSETVYQIN